MCCIANNCATPVSQTVISRQVAMSDQKLDEREVLNVRWAYDDPNPKARKTVCGSHSFTERLHEVFC